MTTWIILAHIRQALDVACTWAFQPEQLLEMCWQYVCKKKKNSFSEARLHTDGYKSSSALRQPGCVGKCFCSNYSLVLGKEREGKKEQVKWNLRRSPQLPSSSGCCKCKFLFPLALLSFLNCDSDMSDAHLHVSSPATCSKCTGLSGRPTERSLSRWQSIHIPRRDEEEWGRDESTGGNDITKCCAGVTRLIWCCNNALSLFVMLMKWSVTWGVHVVRLPWRWNAFHICFRRIITHRLTQTNEISHRRLIM